VGGDTLPTESLQIPAGKSLDKLPEATQVTIWKERIRLGVKWRERTSGRNDAMWTRFKRFYRGDWWGDNYQFEDVLFDPRTHLSSYVPTNRMFAYVRALLPNIYFRNPGIYVTKGMVIQGSDRQLIDDRQVVQDGADYLTRELKIKREIKKTTLTTLITGSGLIQEGFGSQFKVDDSGEEVTGNKLEYSSSIKPGLPWIKNIDPSDFVLPWGCKDFNNTPWCAIRAWRRIEDARNDLLYKHGKKLKATAKPNTSGDKTKTETGQPANWVELWEIRDIQTGQIMIISDGSDLFHYQDEDVLQIEHFPIHMLVFNEDPDSCWGISDLKIMEPQQLELNDARTHEAAYRRRLLSELLMDPAGIVDEKTQARLVNAGNPAKAVLVNKPRENVMSLTTSIPPDIAAAGERIDNDIRHEIGQGRNQGGEANTGRRTAKEVAIVDRSAQLRNDERRDITADFVGDIMNTVMQISFKLMRDDMVKRITGGQLWHKRDPETLPYDLGLEVNAEETRQLDRAGVANGLLSLHERLRGDPVIDPIALTQMILDGLKNIGLPITHGQLINPQIAQIVTALLQQQQGQEEE
jgi:hypothetical protein